MAAKRPALAPVSNLPQEIRTVLEPAFDILSRITSSVNSSRKITRLPLPAGASPTEAAIIATLNALIDRIQED